MADPAAFGMTDEQIAEFKEAFALFDKKGHGSINVKDLGEIMRGMGQDPSDQELLELVTDVDHDGTGDVDFPGFLELMSKKLKLTKPDEELKEAWKLFDRAGQGSFALDELKAVMDALGEKLSDDEIKEMIDEADLDKDGRINYEEFVKMMSA